MRAGGGLTAVADALAGFLDRDDPVALLDAGYGLALRDDPRTAEEYDHRWDAVWEWNRNNGLIQPVD
ncbi:hypothetical protein [Streptomyces sp. JHA19]|uniref:hypothetical protein n=1 Tax=Streptomyces sp. JHA19 TaxID=1577588 RepID=UPI0006E1E017|nr:hypothetical protein [Streptomyces sp. JHA19]